MTVVLGDVESRGRAAVRAGLEHYGFSVVAVVTADEAVEAARRLRPSVCLLDVDMPGGGIDAAERINSELPQTKIAILSGFAKRDRLLEAIRAGADGYLPRSTAPDCLGAALTGLMNGEAALPRSLTGSLVNALREGERLLEQSSNGHSRSVTRRRLRDAIRSYVLYVPRILRHFAHRRRAGMPVTTAWDSARARMLDYM